MLACCVGKSPITGLKERAGDGREHTGLALPLYHPCVCGTEQLPKPPRSCHPPPCLQSIPYPSVPIMLLSPRRPAVAMQARGARFGHPARTALSS
uniref:Uncharacterized protein n=1 Tax=Knipowitschia caucasica TaxID=637954 RepID=A0AAV2JKT6_KNICA